MYNDKFLNLLNDLEVTQRHLRILSGEATIDLYSGIALEDAFFSACDRGVQIDLITGPVLSVGEGRSSLMLRLAENKKINLYYRSKRCVNMSHYRIIDDRFMRLERYHEPAENFYNRFEQKITDSQQINKWIGQFDDLIQTGQGEGFTVKRAENPRNDLLLLTNHEIECLFHFAERLDKNFDNLERNEIDQLYKQWQHEREKLFNETRSEVEAAIKRMLDISP